jgi:hypothetical protein
MKYIFSNINKDYSSKLAYESVHEFLTPKELHGIKYGIFYHTRTYNKFRANADNKKLIKLEKDIKKLERAKASHNSKNIATIKKSILKK